MPPSTTSCWPVMNPDWSGSARKSAAAAMSSGRPTRPTGCWAWSSGRSSSPVTSIHPGRMAFTRTAGPSVMARAWVRARMPPLLAEYASVLGSDCSARVEAMLMIAAWPAARSSGAANRDMR
ncbi:hypothetical protein STH2657 [Symbiobacterium thermophilum IAM 14863]|uniref:Uncharacterized protein n=1 Tax=Symbiobacterium thermophilum (strain DSM 24528 / JCM 14929 / IAM 14863 / T) TaxID=292459 RepID=Q67L04_SYMTH|nr:hypothetical protein STH2657 [Symbiobacterium thermophilum IAM 14863]